MIRVKLHKNPHKGIHEHYNSYRENEHPCTVTRESTGVARSVPGVGHNIESGKDFTVDGLSGFSKKKKKKRRHR